MKKRTISKLKSIFGSKKSKRQHDQQSAKSSRAPSPEPSGAVLTTSGESFRPLLRTPPPSRAGPPPSPPVPTHPIAPVPPEPSGPLPLCPCPVCGRTFVPQSLAKHVKICEKMTVKKRKTFDSSRQRREGTDLEQYLPKNFGLPENSPFLEKSPPNTAKPTPKPKAPSVRSAIMKPTADLQKCPHCNRNFGVRAFERHVEWCADKAKILPAAPAQPPPHIADAKQRLNARTQYKAPLVRGRRSSQSRDKSSNSRSASVESSRGVSPPQPREYSDYRQGRTRASESMSSSDCHDDSSPHIPVIKTARAALHGSCGDANVRARQARLARDLSTSRNTQESHLLQFQQSCTDRKSLQENVQNKTKLDIKKQHQLKKLEDIAIKYSERSKKIIEEQKINRKCMDKKDYNMQKSQIPVLKKVINKNVIQTTLKEIDLSKDRNESKSRTVNLKNESMPSQMHSKEKRLKVKSEAIKQITDSAISLDSLEDYAPNEHKNCQSVGINTELLCPSVPCEIHKAPDQKQVTEKKKKSKQKNMKHTKKGIIETNPTVELLYRNPKMVSSCDLKSKEIYEIQTEICESEINIDIDEQDLNYNCKEMFETPNKNGTKYQPDNETIPPLYGCDDGDFDLSGEKLEENYEHDISEDNFDNSVEKEFTLMKSEENINGNLECRHGSGDTYTKFTENSVDLEEFLALTDTMMKRNESNNKQQIEKEINTLHTPRTISIEALNNTKFDDISKESESSTEKYVFSDALKELKSDFTELLVGASNNISNDIKTEVIDEKRKMRGMEHIILFETKCRPQEINNDINDKEKDQLKLPLITESNKSTAKYSNYRKKLVSQKSNKKYKLLSKQNRTNKEYRTFTVEDHRDESDAQSISLEAPPLKLPRIEMKRLDDNYDPFLSAARQMKELMSSDTNVPKKLQNSSKDPSRTLPILRTKDKTPPSTYNNNNSKMIKDSINKTYQKTPTLQRMKSFGSTNNDNSANTFGGRCSSFRITRNDKKPSQKLNSTFTKSSKENISSTEKTYFNRNSSLNRSFSNYSNSSYSTPKPKDKIPKIATSMYHGFQRTTIKQPLKLDKIKKDDEKKDFVTLDSILAFDNISLADSNYIDPRLINENDNLPINVNTIRNNPDIISSMESLLTTENLPAKFESFSTCNTNNTTTTTSDSHVKIENNNNLNMNNKYTAQKMSDLGSQYDKIISSLEQSITSKTSARDDDSLCEDFDLEEFMTSFDEEVHKQRSENKRTCSSTTRVVKKCELSDSNKSFETHAINSPKIESNRNGMIPVNKSTSLIFSSNNFAGDKLFPSSVKRSTSLLDSLQKKNVQKLEGAKSRIKVDQLEEDLMKSLKDFDRFYESERTENKETDIIKNTLNSSSKKDIQKTHRKDSITNGNYTPNGKASNDSAYSSLNRISPSKLSVCNAKELNGMESLERIPASDSNCSQKEDARSESSEEFLAMERSAELDVPLSIGNSQSAYKELKLGGSQLNEKRTSSRASSRRSPEWARAEALSSSGSESSLHRRDAPRLSRFCHECGNKFPVDTAKFCIQCGVKRLLV